MGVKRLARGRMSVLPNTEQKPEKDSGLGSSGETDDDSDPEADRLEGELDSMYAQYQERKSEADAKYRAKKSREEHDDEWEGVSAGEEQSESSDSSDLEEEDGDSVDDDVDGYRGGLLKDLSNAPAKEGGLSRKAAVFFSQDLSMDLASDDPQDKVSGVPKDDCRGSFEVVKQAQPEEDWEEHEEKHRDGRPDIDIITAEAMTLAHQLATGEKTTHDAVDDGFNKYAFRDRDGLPDWFMDDEGKHDKPQKPTTKAAARAIQEKMRAYNARPIKKVREAQARKKFKAAQKLEKLKKKSDMLANDEGMTEKEKAETIHKLLSKAAKKKPSQPAKLVVARGVNRGVKGRPQGVKGRYRIVDPRMKKELRAQKRISKKKKR